MILENKVHRISMQEIIGKGYADFCNFKGRYRVVKGSRASKKSKTCALDFIKGIMKYPQANLLVTRKTYRTLKDSCYSDLKWAVHRLKADEHWAFTTNPLEMTYLPTGQKILFRGLDDPLKVTSISVDIGCLCWLWIEEAYEITNEEDFDMLDESIRGEVPEGLYKQITITFNPWNEKHWLKKRFFDNPSDDTLAITTNYMCNEWLDESDKKVFEKMKVNNPRRYQVAGLGNWGIVDGLVYENWKEEEFTLISRIDYEKLENKEGNYIIKDHLESTFGLDFGYTNDPSALFCGLVDRKNMKIYVFDEMYEKGLSNKAIYQNILNMGYAKEHITADSAEPKSIDELRNLGLYRVSAANKGKDSINNGIQYIQDFEIIIHPRCVNFLTEISNYTWDNDKFGNKLNKPIDDFNHLLDAFRYAMERFNKGKWLY
jgi:phage terminase large subunit